MVNWKDIQERAESFAFRYKEAKDEDRDAKPFWKDLLELYGIDPRQIGAFEERVRIHGRPGVGKIDYFAPGKFIIEHKSRGKDLATAYLQAMDYFDALKKADKPRHIIVSDFARFRVYDLEALNDKDRMTEFTLEDLPKRVSVFAFFTDEEVRVYKLQEPIDVKAVRAIGKLHAALKASNYSSEHLSQFLTRIVFCCFADDTGIFEQGILLRYLEENTNPDGSDIGAHLNSIFDILRTPEADRQTNIHSTLENLPYVNGGLFTHSLAVVFASRDIRDTLLICMEFDWSLISPAVFGSMFQSVMDEQERRDLGAHYTSETNILKVINGLFLEELQAELETAKSNKEKLLALQNKLAAVTLLDPACGCGNFLVVAYRELRRLENEIIVRLYKKDAAQARAGYAVLPFDVDLSQISKLSIENMYGIEIDSFPAEVAKLSLWLMDHKMNMELGALFGKPLRKLPLKEAAHIVQENALRVDWELIVPKEKLSYVLGNPPFIGAANKKEGQIDDMKLVFPDGRGGKLDYVAAWYKRAIEYVGEANVGIAFVSTNSIVQGEQVALLWPMVWEANFHINFAHQTFKWTNEAPGKAAVYCIIIGLSHTPRQRRLYLYPDVAGQPHEKTAININGYLVDGSDIVVDKRRKPISAAPQIIRGSIPYDGGFLLMNEEERIGLITLEPEAAKYVRRYGGSREMLNNDWRYCLWLVDASPEELRRMPEVMKRVNAVKNFRETSTTTSVLRVASTPYLFGDNRQPSSDYLMLPRVSSERRYYLPIAYVNAETIVADSAYAIPKATHYHFGVLESEMHMTWMRAVCGRLESRYRYSKDIVYNNFPWPEPSDEQKEGVEAAARATLNARAHFSDATLADLYDPNTMPKALLDAHKALDRAVDACYGLKKPFDSEAVRLEFLFGLYRKLAG